MKQAFRKIARRAASWPYIGRLVRIVIATIRAPQSLDRLDVHSNLLKQTEAAVSGLRTEQQAFFNEQLPQLLQSVADINSRQCKTEADKENLVRSVPVALRAITRQLQSATQKFAKIEDLDEIKAKIIEKEEIKKVIAEPESTQQLKDSVKYLLQRVEFVRSELMFEMRYGASNKKMPKELTVGKIISQEKFNNAKNGQMRLNIGCGHICLPDYLNVDRRELPGVDIVAEIDSLPFKDNEVDEIYSAHVLEHFPQEQLRRSLLPYFLSLLRSGGLLRSVVPDAEAMIARYAEGSYPYEDLREVLYGGQDYEGDFHFNMFTPGSLKALLQESGFVNVEIVESARKNGKCYEFEIMAGKA